MAAPGDEEQRVAAKLVGRNDGGAAPARRQDWADRSSKRWRFALRVLAAVSFVAAGANHFREPEFYRRIVPPGLPDPAALVVISGISEIAGGIGLLVEPLQSAAGWGLIALLICVFPANVYMAISSDPRVRGDIATWILWLRLPLQVVIIAWVWFVSARD